MTYECERCGEPIRIYPDGIDEAAEVVALDGTILLVHVNCMQEGDRMA